MSWTPSEWPWWQQKPWGFILTVIRTQHSVILFTFQCWAVFEYFVWRWLYVLLQDNFVQQLNHLFPALIPIGADKYQDWFLCHLFLSLILVSLLLLFLLFSFSGTTGKCWKTSILTMAYARNDNMLILKLLFVICTPTIVIIFISILCDEWKTVLLPLLPAIIEIGTEVCPECCLFINHLLLFFCFCYCYCYCYEYFVRWVKNCFYCIQQSSRLAFAKIVAYLWWHPLIPLPWWHSLSILYSFCTGSGNHRDWHLRLPRLVPTALVAFLWWHSLSVLYILYMYMLIKDNWKQPFYWFWIGV